MFTHEMMDGVEFGICEDGRMLHSIGAMDSSCEVELVTSLIDGICRQLNNQEHMADVGRALFAYLHAFDGQFTLGELMVVLEKATRFLAPFNRE